MWVLVFEGSGEKSIERLLENNVLFISQKHFFFVVFKGKRLHSVVIFLSKKSDVFFFELTPPPQKKKKTVPTVPTVTHPHGNFPKEYLWLNFSKGIPLTKFSPKTGTWQPSPLNQRDTAQCWRILSQSKCCLFVSEKLRQYNMLSAVFFQYRFLAEKFSRKNFKGKSGYENPVNFFGGETH